jgi:hypothetical protein
MPVLTIDITPTTDLLPTYAFALCDGGVLESVSATVISGVAQPGECHVQICPFSTAATDGLILAALVDDYVYIGAIPSWTGKLHLESGCGLMAIVRASATCVVRVQGLIFKRDP